MNNQQNNKDNQQTQIENDLHQQLQRSQNNQVRRQIPPRCYQNHIQREHHQDVTPQ